MSTNPTSARSRRPAGTPTGGQFAPEAHAEPEIALSASESENVPTTAGNGDTFWRSAGGQLHRTDGPAVEYADGSREWWVSGQRHRTDGPAIERASGSREWWVSGRLHRTDGPAVEYANGARQWWVHDRLHRDDGPAVENTDGTREWWVDGKRLTEEEFRAATAPRISFSATALREHFEGDREIEPLLDGLTDAEIEAEADEFLASPAADDLWGAFHLAACDIVRGARRLGPDGGWRR